MSKKDTEITNQTLFETEKALRSELSETRDDYVRWELIKKIQEIDDERKKLKRYESSKSWKSAIYNRDI